jgi:hypothetical protein
MDWQAPDHRTLDELVAFDAMRIFLETYWEEGLRASDDIAVLLGSLSRDAWANGQPLDLALWDDWRAAVDAAVSKHGPR